MIMDNIGWIQKKGHRCPECGMDEFYIRPAKGPLENEKYFETKTIHREDCKQLPVIFPKK